MHFMTSGLKRFSYQLFRSKGKNANCHTRFCTLMFQCGRDESDDVDEDQAKEDAQELFDVSHNHIQL